MKIGEKSTFQVSTVPCGPRGGHWFQARGNGVSVVTASRGLWLQSPLVTAQQATKLDTPINNELAMQRRFASRVHAFFPPSSHITSYFYYSHYTLFFRGQSNHTVRRKSASHSLNRGPRFTGGHVRGALLVLRWRGSTPPDGQGDGRHGGWWSS